MKIHIFTIATGVYNKYLEYQFKTVQYIFPGIDKTYNVISDMKPDFSMINCNDIKENNYYHICNMPYPLISLHTYLYVYDMCKLYNYDQNDYFICIDADTIFCDKSNCKIKNIWNIIIDDLVSNDFCYAFSPWNYEKIGIMENEHNKLSCSHIDNLNDDNYMKYSQFSFLMGKISKLYNLIIDIYNMESYDLNNIMYMRMIPYIHLQSYFNKIVYEMNTEYKLHGNWYIHNAYELNNIMTDFSDWENWLSPYCICMQKWKNDIKEKSKRNSTKFNINI